MGDDVLSFQRHGKKFIKKFKPSDSLMKLELNFDGFNEDIVESYYWHLHFAYFVGLGYKALKLEDHHYFTENSQFGTNLRQVKGGAIRAFQENLNQMIQLVKVHLMPLLQEIKKAEFYKDWFDAIKDNDNIIQSELDKGNLNSDKLKKARKERDEAISHIKDKWVNEVDGGRMWQMNRSASEQGLDFALLPQLFFGINLSDPLQKKKTIKEQLDEDVYPVDISQGAKEQVARFMYRFYTWLPTAIRDTEVNFKMRVSALKQFYAQLMMYANFMKPLLLEVHKKTEGFEKNSFYRGFENEDPDFVNLFDYSYSYIKVAGIKGFERKSKHKIEDLEFCKYGLYIDERNLKYGKQKEKSGYLFKEEDDKYAFIECEKDISQEEYTELMTNWKENPIYIYKDDLLKYSVIMMDFSQRRRNEIVQSQQGPQQVPFMKNQIIYDTYAWNFFEIAAYREDLKVESLDLISSFIEEINIVKEDLLRYTSDLEQGKVDLSSKKKESNSSKEKKSSSTDNTLLLGPFQALGSLFSPLLPKFNFKWKKEVKKQNNDSEKNNEHLVAKLSAIEGVWKMYSIHKKTKQFIQF